MAGCSGYCVSRWLRGDAAVGVGIACCCQHLESALVVTHPHAESLRYPLHEADGDSDRSINGSGLNQCTRPPWPFCRRCASHCIPLTLCVHLACTPMRCLPAQSLPVTQRFLISKSGCLLANQKSRLLNLLDPHKHIFVPQHTLIQHPVHARHRILIQCQHFACNNGAIACNNVKLCVFNLLQHALCADYALSAHYAVILRSLLVSDSKVEIHLFLNSQNHLQADNLNPMSVAHRARMCQASSVARMPSPY